MAEVRPIDANALMEQLRRKLKSGKTSAYLSNREQGWDEAIKSVMSMVHNQHSTLDCAPVRLGLERKDEAGEWISVKDRLPDIERDYGEHVFSADLLVATPDGLGVAYYCHTTKQWIDALFQDEIIEACYWQPLPEPPKEGDNA